MTNFTIEKGDVKAGGITDWQGDVRDTVYYRPSSDGVCCVDCGKEFTSIMGFKNRPFEGKLQCLLSHYKQTDCENSR